MKSTSIGMVADDEYWQRNMLVTSVRFWWWIFPILVDNIYYRFQFTLVAKSQKCQKCRMLDNIRIFVCSLFEYTLIFSQTHVRVLGFSPNMNDHSNIEQKCSLFGDPCWALLVTVSCCCWQSSDDRFCRSLPCITINSPFWWELNRSWTSLNELGLFDFEKSS